MSFQVHTVIGRIEFLLGVGLRALASSWLLARGHPYLVLYYIAIHSIATCFIKAKHESTRKMEVRILSPPFQEGPQLIQIRQK